MGRDEETLEWCRQQTIWYMWQEPWFRRRYPGYYAFFRFMARIGL